MKFQTITAAVSKTTTISLLIAGLAFAPNVTAAKYKRPKRKFPHGCRIRGYNFKDQLLLLQPSGPTRKPSKAEKAEDQKQVASNEQQPEEQQIQTLYLVHNTSDHPVEFNIKKLDTQTFSPNYDNKISPKSWASFALNQPLLQFKCSMNGQDIDCASVLELCEYNNVKFAPHNQGTYWVIKSGSRRHAVYGSIHNGILLRW